MVTNNDLEIVIVKNKYPAALGEAKKVQNEKHQWTAEDRKGKRKHERFPFIDDVLVDGTKQCTSADISEGGLYISAMQAFEKNNVIDVTILLK